MKTSRTLFIAALVAVMMLVAACGGTASPTAAPSGGDTAPSGDAGGDAAAGAKSFLEAVYTGGDVTNLICKAAGASAAEMKAAFESLSSALTSAGAKLDLTGITYTVQDGATADKATVAIGGKIVADMAGTKQDLPFDGTSMTLPMVKEDGTWKVCGA